jgi:hypothetical protein
VLHQQQANTEEKDKNKAYKTKKLTKRPNSQNRKAHHQAID